MQQIVSTFSAFPSSLMLLYSRREHMRTDIWKDLCVKDFVEVRKLVEDSGVEVSQSIDGSWKARYFEEEEKKQVSYRSIEEVSLCKN